MRIINVLKRNNAFYWTDKVFSIQPQDKIYQVYLEETYINRFKAILELQNNCHIVVSGVPKRVFLNYNLAKKFKEKFYPDGEVCPLFLLH